MIARLQVVFLSVVGFSLGAAEAANAQKKATPADIAADIKAVTAGGNARNFAVTRLRQYDEPLAERQAEVAALLLKMVKANSGENRSYESLLALGVWATDAELKEIKDYLGDAKFAKAAANVYSKKKYPPAAKDLALLLDGGPVDKKDVANALILIGPECEELVLPYLDAKKKKDAVRAAVDILFKIGTQKSVEPLNTAAKAFAKDNNISTAIKQALAKIEERGKDGKDK